MRVFTLGLGDGVSTETCDGIARAGGGMATYIVTAEQLFLGKCVRLVSGARTRPITNIKISWEDESLIPQDATQSQTGAKSSVHSQDGPPQRIPTHTKKNNGGAPSSLARESKDADDKYSSTTPVGALVRAKQAPIQLSFLNGTRLSVFALVPRNIANTTTLTVEFTIPSRPGNTRYCLDPIPIQELSHSKRKTFLHTVVAKAVITDLEHKHDLAKLNSPEALEFQSDIAHYGRRYGLTSRFTSFLAVDDGRPVGLVNDVFGTTSVMYMKLPTPEKQQDHSTTSSGAAARSAPTAKAKIPDDRSILFGLASLQRVDGGFSNHHGSSSSSPATKVINLVSPFCPKRAVEMVQSYTLNIRSAFLAWLWMSLWCGVEARLVIRKVDVWIRKNVGKEVDVDDVQKKLYRTAH
ncbi:hypothetical protein H0H93_000343 [Arthromyces matolae]|nr:hypothetical protein H0H93_000343 [Arthromyces matolae]